MFKIRMKIFSMVLSVVMIGGLILSGCSSAENKTTDQTTTVVSNTTEPKEIKVSGKLKVVIAQKPVDDVVDPATGVKKLGMNKLFAEFNKIFPDIKIEAQTFDGLPEKMQTLLLSNEVDVLFASYEAQYLQGLMLNLKSLIDKKDPNIWALYQDGIINTQRVAINENQIMGLPGDLSGNTIAYDKKLFEDWGVEPLSKNPTPEEILDKAKKLTGKNPKTGVQNYGIYFRGKGSINYMVDLMNNGFSMGTYDRMDLSKATVTLYSPEQKAKIEKIFDYLPYCTPGLAVDQGSERWGTVDNDVAMWIHYFPFNDDVVLKNKTQDRFVLTEGMKYNGTLTYNSPLTWGIAKSCTSVDAAWELIKYGSGPVGQKFIYDNYNGLPSLKKVDITDERTRLWMAAATGVSRNNYFPAFLFSDFRPWLGSIWAKKVDGTPFDLDKELQEQQAKAEAWVKTQKPVEGLK